ncbi:PAS domain S-box protein [Fulvivirga sp. M361]|uniref:hybrid sensor histidine kinase/response regulator n=1 Tax=Fulvivirga sp. M361 TaxID=2594266 RepID=UPI00117A74EC|nr:PAS domain S-box protein [Fulvivirga sp. M361]TRX47195.1 PAS domain S-box protein [Fulvivirga sp. M361]
MKTKSNFMITEDEIEGVQSDAIRVLVIEDSEDDYELMIRHIKKAYANVTSTRVETADELSNSIQKQSWELVISDNTLPGFNAPEALKLVRKSNKIVPFIIVSGTIGEEAAVNAMLSGANDYMLKSNLSRLLPAIKREMREYQNQLERQQMEKKLFQSETNYALLAENVHDLVCLHDPTGKYLWVSPSSGKILGYSSDELKARGPYNGLHPEDDARIRNKAYSRFSSGEHTNAIRFEYRRKRKDGSYIHLETIAKPVFEGQELIRIVSTSRDITKQATAYRLLDENRARLKGVLESLSEGIVLVDNDENIILSNPSANQILGLGDYHTRVNDDLDTGSDYIRNYPEPLKKKNIPYINQIRKGKAQYNQIIEGQHGDNAQWLSMNAVPYTIPGLKKGMVISFQDVTDQINNQEKINRLASELISLIENANAPVFGISPDGKITEWNRFTTKITGFGKKAVIGKKLTGRFILKGYQQELQQLLQKVLKGANITNYELPIVTEKGEIVTILANFMPRRNYKGEVTGVIGVGQDITELIEYRERLELKVQERTLELSKALKKEKELVEMKSRFVSIASHEFRTPLSTIKFATDFLGKYNGTINTEIIHEKCYKINEQVKHMTYLLDDVLTVGKSQAGVIKINPKRIEFTAFFKAVFSEVENQMNNSHKIFQTITTDTEVMYMDEKLLRNILTNILTNAIKFSPGREKVEAKIIAQHRTLKIMVQDWGTGIDEKDSKKIFEPFERGTNVQSIQGTGLGLSIVKKAAELLRGTVEMESRLGEGTKIKITLPIQIHEKNIDR